MNKRLVVKLLGRLLLMEAALMLPALLISLILGQGDSMAFVYAILITAAAGAVPAFFFKPERNDLNPKDGIAVAGLSWIVLSFFGALPFWLSGAIPHFTDAYFETVSGFTTTGATILREIESLPKGILFWRSFTHWIGGMGVLVLTVALLPRLSGRTSQLTRAESPGPTFSKLLPRTSDSAKILYALYIGLTVILFICLMCTGMNVYDALIHAVSTAGTGGFSNYNSSVAGFQNPLVEWIIAVFMLLFGINFALYFYLVRKEYKQAVKNEELWVFLGAIFVSTLVITLNILPSFAKFGDALRAAFFQVTAIVSTTGFMTQDFNLWPTLSKVILLLMMFMGGCAGSTGGGFKVSRLVMLFKSGLREIRQAIHPRKVSVVRLEGKPVPETVLSKAFGFLFLYVVLWLGGALLLSFDNVTVLEAITAAETCISNVGPALGALGPAGNFAGLSVFSKWLCSFLMLAGRLEFLPILCLFSIGLWRKKG